MEKTKPTGISPESVPPVEAVVVAEPAAAVVVAAIVAAGAEVAAVVVDEAVVAAVVAAAVVAPSEDAAVAAVVVPAEDVVAWVAAPPDDVAVVPVDVVVGAPQAASSTIRSMTNAARRENRIMEPSSTICYVDGWIILAYPTVRQCESGRAHPGAGMRGKGASCVAG